MKLSGPRLLLLAGTGMALLSSCAPERAAVVADTRAMKAEVLAAEISARASRVRKITGQGSVSFESHELAGSAYFDLALKKPDSLLISFEGPFGISAGFFFLSAEKFVMYNSLENRVTTGTPSAKLIRSVIPFELSVEQIMDAFTGAFPLPGADPASFAVDEGRFLLVYTVENRSHSFWIDPSSLLVVRYAVRDASGELILEANTSRIVERDSVYAPARISVVFPEDGRRLSINYTSIDLNPAETSFVYAVPPNARKTVR